MYFKCHHATIIIITRTHTHTHTPHDTHTHSHSHTHSPTHPHTTQGGSAEVQLDTGHVLKLSTDLKYRECGDATLIYIDYENIVKIILPGDLIYIDDGLISLKVTDKGANWVSTGECG